MWTTSIGHGSKYFLITSKTGFTYFVNNYALFVMVWIYCTILHNRTIHRVKDKYSVSTREEETTCKALQSTHTHLSLKSNNKNNDMSLITLASTADNNFYLAWL